MKKTLISRSFAVFTLFMILCGSPTGFATTWTTISAGAANTLSNWSNGMTSPSSFTTPGDKWVINMSMTLPASATWILGAASSAPDTVVFAAGGTLSMSGAGSSFTMNVYGDMNFTGGTLSLGGAGTTCNVTVNGNVDISSGTISSIASSTDLYLHIYGSFSISGGTVTTTGASSTLTQNSHGSFKMSGGNYNAGGAGGVITTNIYGDCAITGTGIMTNTGAGCTNTVHLALNRGAGTMNIYNTSTGIWSGTNVFIDTNCVAQLAGDFSTTTGSAAFGLTVNGTLICPAAYVINGTRKFILNGVATLMVGHATGINSAIVTTGTRTFSNSANYGFNGTAAQVTGTDMPASLIAPDTIIISNPMGVTLSQTTSSTGSLRFTSGVLHTGANTISLPGAAASVSGAGLTNYVEGTLIKTISGLTTVNYEVGDTSYAPMSLALSAAGTAGSFSVKVNNGLHPNVATSGLLSSFMTTHYWAITNLSAAGPATVTPTATYNLSTILSGSNYSFYTQKYSASAWLPTPRVSTNTTSPYTTKPDTAIALASLAGDYIFGRWNNPTLVLPSVSNTAELRIFPNPNNGTFILSINADETQDVHVIITDILGKKVKELALETNRASDVKISSVPGVYLLSVYGKDVNYSAKVIVE